MFATITAPVVDVEAAPAAVGRPARRRRGPGLTPYLYLAPAVLLLALWVYKPLVETFQLSFVDWNLVPTSPATFVGLQNYADVLALPEMHQALVNTAVYTGAFLVLSIGLPLGFALVARRVHGRAKSVYQALIFVPFLITPIATCAVWRWLFAADSGAITRAASSAGVELGDVFRDENLAIWAIIVTTTPRTRFRPSAARVCSARTAAPSTAPPIERRDDVLVFSTPPLEQDVEVTGPIKLVLYAATDGPDTDFTATLVDVHPRGAAINICEGIIRARYRESMEHPTLIEPDRVYEYTVDLWETSNVFKAGHQIRLEISSSNFPRFARNLNTGGDLATETEIRVAQPDGLPRRRSGRRIWCCR